MNHNIRVKNIHRLKIKSFRFFLKKRNKLFLSDCHRYTDSFLDEKKKRPDRTPDVIAKYLIFLAELSEKKHNFWLAFMYNDVTNVVSEKSNM
jgi:hypothetical protein